jgi:hypothetical protein
MGDALPTMLLNLNQAQSNGVVVDDVLQQFGGTHSIFIPQHNLRLPLCVQGVLSCLSVRLPTTTEIETCEWIEVTSTEEWDPKSSALAERERAYQDGQVHVKNANERFLYPIISSSPHSVHPNKPAELTCSIASARSSPQKSNIDAVTLARQWGIGLDTAMRTINAATQLAIRQAIHPIQRRFHTEVM